MRLSDFDFDLPPELIAQHPVEPREAARLLHLHGDGSIGHHRVADLVELFDSDDLLVFNDTRVIPARLIGMRGEATVSFTLHKQTGSHWEAFAKPARRLRAGDTVTFTANFSAQVISKNEGIVTLNFGNDPDFFEKLDRVGQMPLPPYIKRAEAEEQDRQHYQTVFAHHAGAVAAPTAGLHFTESLLMALAAKGVSYCFVTLHVGGGTFLPVKEEDISKHVMHTEWISVTSETASLVNHAKALGKRIVAIGTTSMRTLESASDEAGILQPMTGDTGIFITPGYRFRMVDRLLTNFHLPKSTLFMLVSAFSGVENMKKAYHEAINHQYRFFSYGDACLLEKRQKADAS